jgi:hypothetical protein
MSRTNAKVERLLTIQQFRKTLSRPKSAKTIRDLCARGRIPEARRPGTEWLIPENAHIEGAGIRLEYGENEGISVSEYADLHGRTPQRVYQLLSQGRIIGARRTSHGWDIPADSPWPADDGIGQRF